MKTIAELTAAVDAAQEALRGAREARSEAIISRSPYKVGDTFTRGSMTYKVRRVTASAAGANVWLACHYLTSTKKWSRGEKLVSIPVED